MCILFIVVGDGSHPTLIGNNRDEYLNREAIRGQYVSDRDQYFPLDKQAGGSWLWFDQLSTTNLRYVVVLNLDVRCVDQLNESDGSALVSRGLLVRSFIENKEMNPEQFSMLAHRESHKYRPFNLIVGNHTGTYYTSSYDASILPKKLETGEIYGISNGHILHRWPKTELGMSLIAERRVAADIARYFHEELSSEIETDDCDAAGADPLASVDTLRNLFSEWCAHMFSVLQTDMPLPDAETGVINAAATQLAAIFVRPVIIPREHDRVCHTDPVVEASARQHATTTTTTATATSSDSCNSGSASIDCEILSTQPDMPAYMCDKFGTRTSTVLVHLPLKNITTTTNSGGNTIHIVRPHKFASETHHSGLYMVQENDYDNDKGLWSMNTFTNLRS